MQGKAVVLFSGGQDSTTCLAWAIRQVGIENVYPMSFDYGQRHAVELRAAARILSLVDHAHTSPGLTSRWMVMQVPQLKQIGGAALVDSGVDVEARATAGGGNEFAAAHGLPSTFVPGRNMLFFTLAAAYGVSVGALDLVSGVCAADRAGYPDCRREFVGAAATALSEALGERVSIHTPLISLDKARTWQLAADLGVLDIVVRESHTCYQGDHTHRHVWGYGCGVCPACAERKMGFIEAFPEVTVT